MRPVPRSLAGRLLGIAAITTMLALAFAAMSIGHVLERFVTRGVDTQLDAQLVILAAAIGPDGRFDTARGVPSFGPAEEGWSWRVDGPAGHWSSADAPPLPHERPPLRRRDSDDDDRAEPHPGESDGPRHVRLHYRQLTLARPGGDVLVTANAPMRIVEAPLREAMVPLLVSLALLGAGLALATVVQLRVGLRPLRALGTALAAVRTGAARHIPLDQPAELVGIATELNALIDQNAAGLDHARRHVSNLAHGLKTPLSALALRLDEPGRDADGSLRAMVAQIDGRVRHHLGRARARAPGGDRRSRTLLAPAVADLVSVLGSIHAERALDATVDMPDALAVAVDPQDLDEVIGNLLDNAWRHAATAIRVSASAHGPDVVLGIEDDGPGLADSAAVEALVAGRRLDERGDGHGFGLSIALELAQMNGGGLTLDRSPTLGGLRASVTLPQST